MTTTKSRSDRPRLLIVGHGRHGKDTAAALLARRLGLSWASTSDFVGRRAVWPLVRDLYPDWPAAYADRDRHRELWFHAIRAYNLRPGPSLAAQVFARHDVYVGIRARAEFQEARALASAAIWIDAAGRVPIEGAGSIEIGPRDADWVLDNNGDLAALGRAVAGLAGRIGAGGA